MKKLRSILYLRSKLYFSLNAQSEIQILKTLYNIDGFWVKRDHH